ncbi:phage major capsid protein [Mycobacterium sp.]|uniref:phage major capsid protein n=1 Tax=Mycobacterium sp. TaxID=1785 RepID=UPI00262A55BF|nr:phage major capsid protein [Mycobacterium sp.]
MNRRAAIAKATVDTTVAAGGLLSPEQSAAFHRTIKDKGSLLSRMRQEVKTAPSGEINKLTTGARLIRAATENADDGYRAGASFPTVPYQSVKIRLPWEVTEDVFHENIEGQQLEADLTDEFTTQFSLDLEDLAINGDTAAGAGADQAFLQIDNGLLKLIATANVAGRNIDGSTINAGAIDKAHYFEAMYAMPNKYRNQGAAVWIMSPNRAISWWESLTDRTTASGDSLLAGLAGQGAPGDGAAKGPLGVPILTVPAMPDDTILLANPRNFVRIVTWDVRKRKVTGETDSELALKDKRLYVFFVKQDTIVEEYDAVVRVHSLAAIA